jgi:hypothetical protein
LPDDEWLRLSEAASLVAESSASVRRRAEGGGLRSRQALQGRPGLEVAAEDVWQWRSEKLARLQVHSDPLRHGTHGDVAAGDLGRFTSLLEDLAATRAALETAQVEIERLREALTLALAADDAGEDRAKTWKGVVRALTGPTGAPTA